MEQKEWVRQLLWFADICFSFTILESKWFVELSFHMIMLKQRASPMRFFFSWTICQRQLTLNSILFKQVQQGTFWLYFQIHKERSRELYYSLLLSGQSKPWTNGPCLLRLWYISQFSMIVSFQFYVHLLLY